MSSRPNDRRWIIGGALCALLALSPALAAAQAVGMDERETRSVDLLDDPSPLAIELARRLDSLHALVAEAGEAREERQRRDAALARQAAAALATLDTIRVGMLTVVTPSEESERTRRLFARQWDEHFSYIERAPGLSEALFVFQWSADPVPILVEGGTASHLRMEPWIGLPRIEAAIRSAIGNTLSAVLHGARTRVGGWAGGTPLTEHDRRDAYRYIATHGSRVARDCLDGDTSECTSAFGLGIEREELLRAGLYRSSSTIEQVRDWYLPAERRAIIAGSRLRFDREEREPARRCIEEHDIAACDRLIQEARLPVAPFPSALRASLLAHAIEVGGSGAWERLIDHPERDPESALANVSGMSLEALVASWLERVVESRPESHAALVPTSGLALLWTLVFTTLAMRSTRWRFA